jgi:hypothetical protein
VINKKESVRIETFSNANGYTARVEGDTQARVFGDVNHYSTAAQAARIAAAESLGFHYFPTSNEVIARHVGNGVYVCKCK